MKQHEVVRLAKHLDKGNYTLFQAEVCFSVSCRKASADLRPFK